jgi:hypothetical protein
MTETTLTFEVVSDPAAKDRAARQMDQFRQYLAWLQEHWSEILPQVRGKYLAVAGREAFISADPLDAWSRARAAHPEDLGAFSQFVLAGQGPRIYANRR